jgi:hypothetical protein
VSQGEKPPRGGDAAADPADCEPRVASGRSRRLQGAIQLISAGVEYTLTAGRVLVGRASSCQVVVADPLVSREHAAIHISPFEVVVEDLHSANGVYVNNLRMVTPQPLCDGDRLLVGTHEFSVFAVDPEQPPGSDSSSSPAESPPPFATASSEDAAKSTHKADALTILGRVMDRMLETGLPEQAEFVLADHLQNILTGARSGLPVPSALCDLAARRALALAQALGRGRWLDYAVELHLRAQLCMTPETAALVSQTAPSVSTLDATLLERYRGWLRSRQSPEEATRDEVLAELERIRLPR